MQLPHVVHLCKMQLLAGCCMVLVLMVLKMKNALNGTCTMFLVYFLNSVCHICLICIMNRVKMFSASLSSNFFFSENFLSISD